MVATIGNTEILILLLEEGADLKAQNSEPLIAAARNGHIEIFKLHLEAGETAQDSLAEKYDIPYLESVQVLNILFSIAKVL